MRTLGVAAKLRCPVLANLKYRTLLNLSVSQVQRLLNRYQMIVLRLVKLT